MKTPAKTSGFGCMECGHLFKTLVGAKKAMFGAKGCPKCGGADIDLTPAGIAAYPSTVNS